MNHVICTLHPEVNEVHIRRDGEVIGLVQKTDVDPLLVFFVPFPDSEGLVRLTFNDIAIIQDNWVALQELRGKNEKVVDKF
jgi:hypothetical protein